MQILFDQGTPVPLRRFLNPHTVETAFERGWSTLGNGQLLDAAEHEGYDVLVTTDQNIRYQQNLQGRTLAVVVLRSTDWSRIRRVVIDIKSAIDAAEPGTIRDVTIP